MLNPEFDYNKKWFLVPDEFDVFTMETDYEFAPRAENITENGLAGAGSVTNVRIYRVNFTFSEMLPNYLPS